MSKLETLRDLILSQNPTDQQRGAIFADELEFLLRAAPGSGKTWTSCRRFIWRGANWPYSAGGLALLSFTNVAIREFQESTIKVGRRDLLSDPNYVGTFDAFVERFILTPFGHLIVGLSKRPKLFIAPRPGDWNNEKLVTWAEFKGKKRIKVPAWQIIPYPDLDNNKTYFKASQEFGGQKVEFSRHNPVTELLSLGFYTHAQRVYWVCRLLFARPYIAELIARRFPEIIVDEAQDTNVWLLVLLNFLRSKGAKITLVGDPDQCIYEFSMADATSLPALKKNGIFLRCHSANHIGATTKLLPLFETSEETKPFQDVVMAPMCTAVLLSSENLQKHLFIVWRISNGLSNWPESMRHQALSFAEHTSSLNRSEARSITLS